MLSFKLVHGVSNETKSTKKRDCRQTLLLTSELNSPSAKSITLIFRIDWMEYVCIRLSSGSLDVIRPAVAVEKKDRRRDRM